LIYLPREDRIYSNPEAFKKMKKLRLFINSNIYLFEKPNLHSNELRVLDCFGYHGESLPSNFCGKNLVVLRLHKSKLKELEGVQVELSFLIFLGFNYIVNFFQSWN
jgi:hypothetical protein